MYNVHVEAHATTNTILDPVLIIGGSLESKGERGICDIQWCPYNQFIFVSLSHGGEVSYYDVRSPMYPFFTKGGGVLAKHVRLYWPTLHPFVLVLRETCSDRMDSDLQLLCLEDGFEGCQKIVLYDHPEGLMWDIDMNSTRDNSDIVICDSKGKVWVCKYLDSEAATLLGRSSPLQFEMTSYLHRCNEDENDDEESPVLEYTTLNTNEGYSEEYSEQKVIRYCGTTGWIVVGGKAGLLYSYKGN